MGSVGRRDEGEGMRRGAGASCGVGGEIAAEREVGNRGGEKQFSGK